jgi:hypothetical protein
MPGVEAHNNYEIHHVRDYDTNGLPGMADRHWHQGGLDTGRLSPFARARHLGFGVKRE